MFSVILFKKKPVCNILITNLQNNLKIPLWGTIILWIPTIVPSSPVLMCVHIYPKFIPDNKLLP